MRENNTVEIPIRSVWRNPIHFLAFGFGSGTLPLMPGTWGTLAAIPLFLLMSHLSILIYSLITVVLIIVGIWLCDITAKDIGVHDYKGIVWDEIVGYLVTMVAVPVNWLWIILGFFLFRLFDIWKPWPIRLMDKNIGGGLGIVIDDVVAGIYACLVLQILLFCLHL